MKTDYLSKLQSASTVAVDTEWARGKPWCLSFSVAPGTSRVIMADNHTALAKLNDHLSNPNVLTVLHNAAYDLPVLNQMGIHPAKIADTMIMAYLLQTEPQGLKPLAYRHCGMEMQSYSEVVAPATYAHAMEYITKVASRAWPDPDPVLEWKDGKAHVRKPQNIRKKALRILKGVESKGDNPAEKWKAVKEGKEVVEAEIGPLQEGELCDIPLDKAIYYSCLSKDSKVLTESGYISIEQLVKKKMSTKVWCLDLKSDYPVLKPITGWYRNVHEKPIQWRTIETLHSIRIGGLGKKKGGVVGTRYTPDHKVLTPKGWRRVDRLHVGDEIYIPVQRLSYLQRQIVIGCTLGDGHISRKNTGGWAKLYFYNRESHLAYTKWKAGLSKRFTTKQSLHGGKRLKENHERQYVVATESHPELLETWWNVYGGDRGKRDAGHWCDEIGPIALAIWYQDDGTLVSGRYPRLCTNWATKKGVKYLQKLLLDRFGIETNIQTAREDQWMIGIPSRSCEKFFSTICQYVHPCMQYKLPREWRGRWEEEVSGLYDIPPGMCTTEIERVYINPPPKGGRGQTYISYCIDVEGEHNFFTRGEIAHNCRDADATIRVWPILWERIQAMELEGTFWRDMAALPMVVDMMANGMPVNLQSFAEVGEYFQQKMDELQAKMQREVNDFVGGKRFNPGSNPQVAAVIYDYLELHTKRGKFKSKKGNVQRSTAAEVLKRYIDLHPFVAWRLEWKEYEKLKNTYADVIPRKADPDGRVRTTLRITRVVTGRLSSSSPNLLAQPTRSDEGRKVRDCYECQPGRVFLSGDYSGVEMRVAAENSRDEKMMTIFWTGGDLHSITASEMFGIPLSQVDDKKHRYPAKRIGFGILYMITAEGLHRELESTGITGWTVESCADAIKAWFELYKGIAAFMKQTGAYAKRYGYVRDMWGRVRYIPGIRSTNKWVRLEAERQAGNAPIQSGAQGIIKDAMGRLVPIYRRINAELGTLMPLLQIHDDLLWETEEWMVPIITPILKKEMCKLPPNFIVPLEVDFKSGAKWGSMKKVE